MVKDPALDMSKVYALGEVQKQLEPPYHLVTAEEGWWWGNTAFEPLQNWTSYQKKKLDARDDTVISWS